MNLQGEAIAPRSAAPSASPQQQLAECALAAVGTSYPRSRRRCQCALMLSRYSSTTAWSASSSSCSRILALKLYEARSGIEDLIHRDGISSGDYHRRGRPRQGP